jgi:hypothetical protein
MKDTTSSSTVVYKKVQKRDALGTTGGVLYPVLAELPLRYHAEVTRLVTLQSISRRSKTEGKRIYEGYILEHGYHRQIFVHHMNTNNHELNITNSKDRMLAASKQLDEIAHVVQQTTIDIADNMFYAFHQFHLLPHGGCNCQSQQSTENGVKTKSNNGNGAAVHHIRMDQPRNMSHKCVRVYLIEKECLIWSYIHLTIL